LISDSCPGVELYVRKLLQAWWPSYKNGRIFLRAKPGNSWLEAETMTTKGVAVSYLPQSPHPPIEKAPGDARPASLSRKLHEGKVRMERSPARAGGEKDDHFSAEKKKKPRFT